ncbi:MAG: gliding motility-associated C-terminal domain-containing protein [Flavobacteriales bacterium]
MISQENTAASCADGIDNDGDGLVDCEDGDCESICAAALLGECVGVTFENVFGEEPMVMTPIENQYLSSGVKFSLSNGDQPFLVDYGGFTEGFTGVGGDTPAAGFEAVLGNYFLTDDGISGGLSTATIWMDFVLPVNEVSGQILDIDNDESFTARAIDGIGNIIDEVVVSSGDPNTGNGVPSSWSLETNGNCITRVVLAGVSDGFTSFGYGLDNFEFCYADIDVLCQCSDPDDDDSWLNSICFGCTDPEACNFNPNSLNEDDSCIYPDGCTDALACNYDPDAECDDGSCLFVEGCTDPEACNYDATAECDGNCIYPDGCTDPSACNYLFSAQCDDGSCTYPDGCTDATACNYDLQASCDDGSCDYSCLGCTDPEACNYEPEVTVNDGSCTYEGCINPIACNYDAAAGCDDGSCILPDGCNSPAACNYDPSATCDDGSCDFTSCADCAGVPFGESVIDTCGVCLLPTDTLFNFSCVGDLFIPNSFTPNNDGLNEVFQVQSARPLTSFQIWIYNRWGDLIYTSTDPTQVWDGSHESGNHYVQNGVYSYRVQYNYGGANSKEKTGHISVFR